MERLSLSLESYLENIAELQEQLGAVNTSALAEKMGCKRSSVTSALCKLSENGLINYQSYRPVTLTEKGKAVIASLDRYHQILENFLHNVLALDKDFAQTEACRLEHQISPETIERIAQYTAFLKDPEAFKKSLKKK